MYRKEADTAKEKVISIRFTKDKYYHPDEIAINKSTTCRYGKRY